ncbi:MAG: NADP oxidoreductase, partial [Gammaproteobacteria bacterium]|nr:NADP oxidoreductase [Gammaproteobacteria bacterium]
NPAQALLNWTTRATSGLEELEKTDIADHALGALRKSNIEEVVILGRRSHLHAAYNNPELEEFAYLPGVEIRAEGDGLPSHNDEVLDELDWVTKRKLKTLSRLAERKVDVTNKRIVFRFLSSPAELVGNGRVEKIQVIRNRLELNEDGKMVARPTGEKTMIETGLVLRAIGYRGHPFPGLPFDESRGVIDNVVGRVADKGEVRPGVYVVGWIKRGPQGIIGTNKQCAVETVSHLLSDVSAGRIGDKSPLSSTEVSAAIALRKKEVVSESGWRKIDVSERRKGKRSGRPRVKFCSVDEMIDNSA